MIIRQPEPARVLIEEDLWALQTLSHLLNYYGTLEHGDPVNLNDITKTAFLSFAKTLEARVNECTIDYGGEKYIIMAKGRRRLKLGLKREPDLYIGSDYGTNFFEACHNFFMFHSKRDEFNEKKLTFYGRTLFGMPVKEVTDYTAGINKNDKGYCVWFTLCNQTYTLASEGKRDAELRYKMLSRTFENLIAIK